MYTSKFINKSHGRNLEIYNITLVAIIPVSGVSGVAIAHIALCRDANLDAIDIGEGHARSRENDRELEFTNRETILPETHITPDDRGGEKHVDEEYPAGVRRVCCAKKLHWSRRAARLSGENPRARDAAPNNREEPRDERRCR